MNEHTSNAKYFRGIEQAQARVAHQCPADTAPLVGLINGEATKHSDRNWIRNIAPKTARRFRLFDGAGSERVVGDDAALLAHDEGPRCAARLIRTGATSQPVVQFNDSGIELGQFMSKVAFSCLIDAVLR